MAKTETSLPPPTATTGKRAEGLPPGARAPSISKPATPDGRRFSLEDHVGSPVVLIFYPADFTPVCSSELGLFNELLPELGRFGARVVGISCDSLWCHAAFARELHLQVPLVSDFHPKGEVSRAYKVYRDEEGFSERALFVIDPQGVIFWKHVSPLEVNPGADGVLAALEQMTGQQLDGEPAAVAQRQPGQEEAQP